MCLAVLSSGLMLILPVGLQVVGPGPETVGAWGAFAGPPLATALGFLGAVLFLSFLLVVLSVGTLGWNPLRLFAYGMAQGSGVMARGAARLVTWGEGLKARWDERARERLERTPPMELLEGEGPGGDDSAEGSEEEPEGADVADEVEDPLSEEDDSAAGDDDLDEPEVGSQEGLPDSELTDEAYEEPDELMPDPLPKEDLSETGLPPVEFMTTVEDEDRGDMERELDALGEVLIEKLRTFNVESEPRWAYDGPRRHPIRGDPRAGREGQQDRQSRRRPRVGHEGQEHPDRGSDSGEGRRRGGDPEPRARSGPATGDPGLSGLPRTARRNCPWPSAKTLNGKPYVADLRKMPHVLIAGTTGSGKSICINTIITSLVYRHTPETLRLLMVDPKMVELSAYKMLPAPAPQRGHRSTRRGGASQVGGPGDGTSLYAPQHERRSDPSASSTSVSGVASSSGVRSPRVPRDDPDRWVYQDGVLPYVVVVIDELADLMMTVQSEVEKPLTTLAQKARAIGIHLIVATQRPSVNVITGLIKANFPARIAFRVASKTDSRTILDQNGADALLGNGDMLFLPPGTSEPVRIQGAYISTSETDRMMGW